MQAILTTYVGPTGSRGSRVRAKAELASALVPYDDALTNEANHRAAAQALADSLGIRNRFISGFTAAGYAHVFLPAAE